MSADISYSLKKGLSWNPPESWQKVTVIDAHTEGEPLRVIIAGFPSLPGESILDKRQNALKKYDYLRKILMWEPRGHADMYGCIITPAVTPDADFGVLFMHNEGFSTMCGHGIIGVATVVLEMGLLEMKTPVTKIRIDTPAGLVTAYARTEKSRVCSVYFHNVPSFVVSLDQIVNVPEYGDVRFDIAFGGAFYAYVKAQDLGLRCIPEDYMRLIQAGKEIKYAVKNNFEIVHPLDDDLSFLYGTIFMCSPMSGNSDSRNVCVFADGEVDRSPTGTGVSGRLAIHFARGEIDIGESITIESIIGSRFRGKVIKTTEYGPYKAVIPEVEGSAYITGKNELYVDPDDQLKSGFLLR